MGNIVSKLGAETPTVGKIQEAMTSVVDYFKTLGYVPKKGSLERVPAADEFVTQYILNNGTDKDWDAWLAKAKKLGEDKVLKIFNDAQKRYDTM